MNTPFPQFGGPDMGRPGFGPGFGFAPPGRSRRHGRREFRDQLREQFREQCRRHDGPPGFGPRGGFGPDSARASVPASAWRSGPAGGRGGRRGHGRGRGRRGDVRAAILVLLAERPMHGYEMIQEIAERSNDVWKPSPGSVYPTLQLLVDEGLIVATESEGSKKLFELTDDGRDGRREDRRPRRGTRSPRASTPASSTCGPRSAS